MSYMRILERLTWLEQQYLLHPAFSVGSSCITSALFIIMLPVIFFFTMLNSSSIRRIAIDFSNRIQPLFFFNITMIPCCHQVSKRPSFQNMCRSIACDSLRYLSGPLYCSDQSVVVIWTMIFFLLPFPNKVGNHPWSYIWIYLQLLSCFQWV